MKKISIFAVVTATLFFAGCIKETFPQAGYQTQDQVDKSEFGVKGLVDAIPASMMSANTAGYLSTYGTHVDFGIPAIHIMTESMLEDLAILSSSLGSFQFYMFLYNVGQNDQSWPISYFWDCYYKWIKMSNDILNVTAKSDDGGQYDVYRGYAYTYRAMCYLDLARLYEPKENKLTDVSNVLGKTVPIVDENTTEQQATNNPRVDRTVMYDFILSDLKKAEQYLQNQPFSYNLPTLAAVYGLYARAYLEMGYWKDGGDTEMFRQAANYARKAIEASGCTPLTQSQWEDPKTGFNSGTSNNAWIWGLTVSSENIGNLFSFNAHMSSESLFGYAPLSKPGASKRFYEGIPDKDFRKHSWLDPNRDTYYAYKYAGNAETQSAFLNGNAQMNITAAVPYQAIKFRPAQGDMLDYTVGGPADHPLMRVEEMYFIEMEAKAHISLNEGIRLLNQFMKYRITDGSYDCTSKSSTLTTWTEEMLFQKRAEFWGEGILMYDYKRLNKGITRKYTGTNHPAIWQFNTDGRSPQWNIVITRGEWQSNTGIDPAKDNNPDPSGKLK